MLVVNRSQDYAFFLRRLCARRILSFLKGHLLEGAAHEYVALYFSLSLLSFNSWDGPFLPHGFERETAVFFDLSHLQYLARRARWEELTSYVTYFIPYPELPSREASTFLGCIHIYRVLSWIAAGTQKAQDIDTLFPLLDESAAKSNPTAAALHIFYHEVRRRPPRDFVAWLKIWEAAAERLKDLALKCPEFKEKLHSPKCAPRRWQINLSGVRPVQRPYKRKVNKQKACDIACFFKKEKR
ncbi:hypothetical protein EJB05_17984, partial [Eragrostis curvula]